MKDSRRLLAGKRRRSHGKRERRAQTDSVRSVAARATSKEKRIV